MSPLDLDPAHARRFMVRATGLERPADAVGPVLDHLGYVQLDPIQVCGRMHDLILRHRVEGYREDDLLRHAHPESGGNARPSARVAFEHYLPGRGILAVFPIEAWPMIDAVLHDRRAPGRWAARPIERRHRPVVEHILEALRERGPLTSDDIEHDERTLTAWGTPGRLVKGLLEALFHRGDVLICARRGFRRVYDLPERVIPAAVRARPRPPLEEVDRWLIQLALRQRRLVALRRRDVPQVEDLARPVRVGAGPVLHILREDEPVLEATAEAKTPEAPARLLAPLDPVIYDRAVTRRVWDFDYTWEVYTPAARRVRGYYALPVLSRGELVGHVDPRADRDAGRLRVLGRRVRRGHATRDAVRDLAHFLGLRA